MITRFKRLAATLCLGLFLTARVFGQTYSTDLNDIDCLAWSIDPIGDLGELESILDLRGFIPLSAVSKAKWEKFWKWDCNQWYQIPTTGGTKYTDASSRTDDIGRLVNGGFAFLYYGKFDGEAKTKLSKARLLTEDRMYGEDLQWAKLAYGLASSSGKELFASASGFSSGFDGAEPVAILLTARSAIVIMNFRYSDLNRTSGTGQILCGFEFSRTLKEYKHFYVLYRNTLFSRSVSNAFDSSAPYIVKALSTYFFGR